MAQSFDVGATVLVWRVADDPGIEMAGHIALIGAVTDAVGLEAGIEVAERLAVSLERHAQDLRSRLPPDRQPPRMA